MSLSLLKPDRYETFCGSCLAPSPIVRAESAEAAAELLVAAGWRELSAPGYMKQWRCPAHLSLEPPTEKPPSPTSRRRHR